MKKLSWKPKRRGVTYCSSACGHGCTWPQFVRARLAAKRLAKRLGPGWKPYVWENFGWRYQAIKGGVLCVSEYPDHSVAYFDGRSESGKTPEGAVARVVESHKERIRRLQHVLKEVS